MDADELLELWEKNNDRPVFVLEHREELGEYVDTSEPVPESGVYDVRQWLASYKGVVTKQLREATEGEGGDEPTEGGEEGGDTDIGGETAEGE